MFYCDTCKDQKDWPMSFSKSHGKCEICGNLAVCNDIPSKYLPPSKDTSIFNELDYAVTLMEGKATNSLGIDRIAWMQWIEDSIIDGVKHFIVESGRYRRDLGIMVCHIPSRWISALANYYMERNYHFVNKTLGGKAEVMLMNVSRNGGLEDKMKLHTPYGEVSIFPGHEQKIIIFAPRNLEYEPFIKDPINEEPKRKDDTQEHKFPDSRIERVCV